MRATSRRTWRGWGIAVVGLTLVGSAVSGPNAAAGQALYRWPTDTVDVAGYTVDGCLAALDRKGLSWQDNLKPTQGPRVRPDTLPFNPQWWQEPLPPKMLATAQRCAAKFIEPTMPLEGWWLLERLYLAANRDQDAAALIERRLAAAQTDGERKAIVDSAVNIYEGFTSYNVTEVVHPLRFDAAVALLERRVRQSSDKVEQLKDYSHVLNLLQQKKDTMRTRIMAGQVVALVNEFTPAEHARYFAGLPEVVVKVMLYVLQHQAAGSAVDRAALDSLRKGTASYTAFKQQEFQRVVGTGLPMPIGERAPKLTGDFMLPAETARQPRPTPGKVSLIVFCDHPQVELVAVLHRLMERFPALEVTVVAKGEGFFHSVAPPTPAEEAEHRYKEWAQAFYRLPVAFMMTMIPKYQLPAPDKRLMPKPGYVDPNWTHYSFGNTWPIYWFGSAFLVDQQGLIAYASNQDFGARADLLGRQKEAEVAETIEILLHRPVTALNEH